MMRKRATAKLSKLKKAATEFLDKSELSLDICTDLKEPINADTCGKIINAVVQVGKSLQLQKTTNFGCDLTRERNKAKVFVTFNKLTENACAGEIDEESVESPINTRG